MIIFNDKIPTDNIYNYTFLIEKPETKNIYKINILNSNGDNIYNYFITDYISMENNNFSFYEEFYDIVKDFIIRFNIHSSIHNNDEEIVKDIFRYIIGNIKEEHIVNYETIPNYL